MGWKESQKEFSLPRLKRLCVLRREWIEIYDSVVCITGGPKIDDGPWGKRLSRLGLRRSCSHHYIDWRNFFFFNSQTKEAMTISCLNSSCDSYRKRYRPWPLFYHWLIQLFFAAASSSYHRLIFFIFEFFRYEFRKNKSKIKIRMSVHGAFR
jgi:hypothetical protein